MRYDMQASKHYCAKYERRAIIRYLYNTSPPIFSLSVFSSGFLKVVLTTNSLVYQLEPDFTNTKQPHCLTAN
jgi:hypothetical protein